MSDGAADLSEMAHVSGRRRAGGQETGSPHYMFGLPTGSASRSALFESPAAIVDGLGLCTWRVDGSRTN